MSLGQLLVDLSKLVGDPRKHAAQIHALLRTNRSLAEYEVARFYVANVLAGSAKAVSSDLSAKMRDVDPRVRLDAVTMIPLLLPRTVAAKLLRTIVKDPDPRTRKRARHVVRDLELADVALRDPRFDPRQSWHQTATTPGAWNPSGWAFGVYARKRRGALDRSVLGAKGLPVLETRGDVASFLGLQATSELAVLLRPGTEPGSAYVEFEVPKATGGTRRIAAPRKPLRDAQRKVLREILDKVAVHRAAHGFVRGHSTVTNAKEHVGKAIVMKLDLVDFFPSVHYRRVKGLFEELGYPTEAAEALAGIATYRPKLADGRMVWPGVLPQGAPTSPAITNLVCRRLDARLTALAKKAKGTYTRYADDLTFSFDAEPEKMGRLLWWIDQICQQEGFSENTKKRRVFRRSCQQRVTGVVVNVHPAIPRRDRRRLRAIFSNVKKNGFDAEARGRDHFEDYLEGYVAYARMVDPAFGAKLARELDSARQRGGA